MKKKFSWMRDGGWVLVWLSLLSVVGCSTAPSSKPAIKPPSFVCTNWPARKAEIRSICLVAPAVDIVKIGYFCKRQVLTNDELAVSNQLTHLIPSVVMKEGFRLDTTNAVGGGGGGQTLVGWMNSVKAWPDTLSVRNNHFPEVPVRDAIVKLAAAHGDDAVLLVAFVGKDRSTMRVIREDTVIGFGVAGGLAGGCVGVFVAPPVGIYVIGGTGMIVGGSAGWVATGFGDVKNEFHYGLGRYTRLCVWLLDGKSGEVLWANMRDAEFDFNGLDTLVKAVFHQPTL